MRAPDFIEPFEGWRVWRVVRGDGRYRLRSIVYDTEWPAGEALSADCLRRPPVLGWFWRKQVHAAPEEECDCGIYAVGLEDIAGFMDDASYGRVTCVVGRVALWGTVIECERGFRASHAYPACLYVPADAGAAWKVDWKDVAAGLCRYRVPVEALPAETARATRLLAERQAA